MGNINSQLLFMIYIIRTLAEVDILKDMLLFRDNPNLCIGLFVNDEISTAINCICIEWLSDSPIFYICYSSHTIIIIVIIIFLPMCVSFYIFLCCTLCTISIIIIIVIIINNNNNKELHAVFTPRTCKRTLAICVLVQTAVFEHASS